MQLPLVQKSADRTIARSPDGVWSHASGGGNLAEARSVQPLRAQSEEQPPKSLHCARAWRAREPPLAVSQVRAFTRTCSRRVKSGLRKSCSRPKASRQPHKPKRSSLGLRNIKVRARSCQRSFAQPLAASKCRRR